MSVYVPWLADAARTTGYPVVEVTGWRSRGHGGMRAVEGVVGHHTATSAAASGDYPSLNIVTNGRSDLAGPLCNLGLGRSGTVYVVAAGTAWHAGASRWAGFYDLNDEFLGIEAESPGYGEWTSEQLDAYPKLVGALLHYMRRDSSRYAGHKDVCIPPGRKPDPRGIDTGWMQRTAALYAEGDDMFSDEDRRVLNAINVDLGKVYDSHGVTAGDLLVRLAWLFPALDHDGIAARDGHDAGDLTNAAHSAWERLVWDTDPRTVELMQRLEQLDAKLERLTQGTT